MTMISASPARSVADLHEGVVHATIEIAAPPDRIFRAISSKEITQWWGQEGMYQTTDWTGEVKVGGRFKASGAGSDGKGFSVSGEYVEIDPPRKLVHTWEADWVPGKPTTVTYRLDPIDGGTRVTVRHTGFTNADSCKSHADGWVRVLGWLTGFVAPAKEKSFFLVRLLSPRPTFVADMNEAEKRIMMEHGGYWKQKLDEGVAHAFGPVLDPKGPWGVGILEVDDAAAIETFKANDPVIKANIGFGYEILPMLKAVVRR
jgi:uncharacterized protein YndB with AHSA1/START domain